MAFYNECRTKASKAIPNAAHKAIASLETAYDVVVITQNVDDLHERAGSTNIAHLHGRLSYARGTSDFPKRRFIGWEAIVMGQLCENGTQLRPDIVWFGEDVHYIVEARRHVASASKVLVVGTSLSVYPAASLVNVTRGRAEKILNCLGFDRGSIRIHLFTRQCHERHSGTGRKMVELSTPILCYEITLKNVLSARKGLL